jgi:hypothetical protein
MLYKTIFLELRREIAVSLTAMNDAIFLHFPVEEFPIVEEKLKMLFWKSQFCCHQFEFRRDFIFLKGIPIAEGGFCLRITPGICGLDIIFKDIK